MVVDLNVQKFLKANLDQNKLAKFDSEAGLVFLAYETVSLALALLQIESIAWQVNIGFLNFVVSGILFLLFEFMKHTERIDYRIALFRLLRWYILMLVSALIAVGVWYIIYMLNLNVLEPLELVGQVVLLLPLATVSFLSFAFLAKRIDKRYQEGIESMIVDQEDSIVVNVASKFAPSGITNLVLLFAFNMSVFLATLNGEPFNAAFIRSFFNEPVTWLLCIVLLPVAIPLIYYTTLLEQRKLITSYEIQNRQN